MIDLGLQVEPMYGFSYPEIRELAREAERGGFRTIWVSDHFFLNRDSLTTTSLEAWTVLAALAVDTATIRIGPMVSCQSYRSPALLAKMAASVDHLSGGRLEFGIGAGWKEDEYRAYGYDFPSNGVRMDELIDTVAICRKMWTEDRATHAGRHHSVTDAPCAPKPIQTPLPLWIGGRMPRMMRLAARTAEWFNYLPLGRFPTPADARVGFAQLDAACRSVGRDPATLGKSVFVLAVVGEDDGEAQGIAAEVAAAAKLTPADWQASRGAMVGTTERIADTLREYAAAGARHANVRFPFGHDLRMTRLLARITAELRSW
ncbi:MAG: LLM class flavin-dependent oxidoreductase [Chloroflexi bacterium]|nr:LLM class flavin-dependent oxidoreductase [Chloroflexota bacterium]